VIVTLVDYGAGNLRSAANAIRAIGIEPRVASRPAEIGEDATHLIVPGVGAFGDCMEQLRGRGFEQPIRDWFGSGKPFLGICVGYQILFDSSEEAPGVPGLGLVPGVVRRFKALPGLKIPHMGWNSALPTRPGSGNWDGLGEEPYFYFVHSYFPEPVDSSIIAARTTYGSDTFAAAIEGPGFLACQWHPEKSQDAGLRLMRNFLTRQSGE
jgi:imidazole glycerol-phosphate synthase subunit HisH